MNFNISKIFYCTGSSAVLIEKKKQTVKMKLSACHERGTKKKKSESPTGFEPMISQTPVGALFT